MTSMRISQLAERTGVPATTLRFYETAGLLPADRSPAGYRLYGPDAVERLSFIAAAKRLGLPLEEIAELLVVWESGSCADVKNDLRPQVAARLDEAQRRIADMTASSASLHQALTHLDGLADRTGRCGPACGLLTLGTETGGAPAEPSPGSGGDDEHWRHAPVACTLTGQDMADRTAHWRRLLSGAGREPIDEGIRLTLPAERAGELAALAVEEQRCCPFFDFRLHLIGPLAHLDVRAHGDGTALLAELFGSAT